MATDAPQRRYRAPCPGCGAPVEFLSAQSTHAVCGYCHSTVVRSGDVLQRIGKMAEVFDDHSPLQLGAAGRIDGQGFTLIGRLQYQGGEGRWAEWNALLQDGSTATLGEDNGAYVFTREAAVPDALPPADAWQVGRSATLAGKAFSVAAAGPAQLVAAQGELPRLAPLGQPFAMVELRSEDGEVLSIDYALQPPRVERGRSVRLEDLQLTGLADDAVKQEGARQFACPNCGAPVLVKLDSTKSITCPSCASLITLDGGVGGELRHALQDEPVQPLIALGRTGQLEGSSWQVVGFQHRLGQEPGDDEFFGWTEYLLYNRQRGFAFLVDAEDGWSLVRTATGAPRLGAGGRSASYLGKTYQLQSSYSAQTSYVLGEFYWPVQRGQKTINRDYANAGGLLSMEQTPGEITWSYGSRLSAATVAAAFGLPGQKEPFERNTVGPFVASKGVGCMTIIVIIIFFIVIASILDSCAGSSGGYGRSSGGSYGGYSSGGSHK